MSRKHPPVVITCEHSPHRVKHKFWRGLGDVLTMGGVSAVAVSTRRIENAAYNAKTRSMAKKAEKEEREEGEPGK